MEFTTIESLSEFQKVTYDNYAVFIYFSQENCNVCKALKPKVQELISTEFEKIKFCYVDVYNNPEIGAQNGIFMVPTMLLLFEGKEFLRISRNIGLDELKEKIKRPYDLMYG